MYVSTKTYSTERGYSICYRQWRSDSHCSKLHGYALGFSFEFQSETLDVRNWVVDFGGLKSLKSKLDDWFDHTCLVALDDPEFSTFENLHKLGIIKMVAVEKTGCEGISEFLRDYITDIWLKENGYSDRVKLRKVEVRETASNSAYWSLF
jgi:6-pyruvoyltetrahydropterin/6-carboxytetrahydropterin synthase